MILKGYLAIILYAAMLHKVLSGTYVKNLFIFSLGHSLVNFWPAPA